MVLSSSRTLVEACSEGDVTTVRRLLCAGWSANETTEEGESLLSLACSAGYYELTEVIVNINRFTYCVRDTHLFCVSFPSRCR